VLKDLRYTLRAIGKRPSFAIGTILVLGLAVGVNTAVFSLLNLLLLRPLPVPAPERIAFIYHSDPRSIGVGYGAYRDLRSRTADVFTDLAARGGDGGRLRTGTDAIPMRGEAVTPNYFDVIGVAPAFGRTFSDNENAAGANPVAVISDALWKSHFASDPNVLGRSLRIDTDSPLAATYTGWRDYTIVGVMPASFTGTGSAWQPARYWVPIEPRFTDLRAARGDRVYRLDQRPVVPIGRFKPGVTRAQARSAVEAAAVDILRQSADQLKPGTTFRTVAAPSVTLPFQGAYIMDIPRITATLAAVGTILLFIAGVNLAGMLLARGIARRTEIAIRLSLGIGRLRLVRHLLVESVIVALAAGLVGLAIARLALTAALHGFPSQIPGGSGVALSIEVPIDGRVLAFAFVSGLATALLVGLAPALQALRVDLLAALAGGSATTGQSRSRWRRAILIPQIALALVLLLVTGVFVRHLLRAELAHPGYDPRHVVTLDIQLPQQPTETLERVRERRRSLVGLQQRIVARLTSLPGVNGVSVAGGSFDGVPLAASITSIIARSDYETTRQYRGVRQGFVSKDYFETLGIPLLRGRDFDERDTAEGSTSVIVSERFANDVWPGRDPIGEQIAMHSADSPYPIRWRTVIGMVGSVTRPTDEYPWPVFYSPVEQYGWGTTFIVSGDGTPARLAAAAKEAVQTIDPLVLVTQVRAMDDTVSALRYPRRFTAAIVGASGTAALVLAAIGVFALMSYAVAQRRAEIGVRMVLGAQRRDVMGLILQDGAVVAIAGIGLGFALAFAAIRYASHAIVPLPDADTITFLAVPAILMLTIFVACYLPARRAARVDPLVVLRNP
jgi:putative ABC transport system permease protein